jgi:hypothetical protein
MQFRTISYAVLALGFGSLTGATTLDGSGAGCTAGALLLAGHGANMSQSQTDIDTFNIEFKQFALTDPGLTPNEVTFLDSVLPSPEPSASIAMLCGAGLIGLGRRRRTAR